MLTEPNRDILVGQKLNDGSGLKYTRYQLDADGTTKVKLIGDASGFEAIVRNQNSNLASHHSQS